jgi:ABC-2 type transport system permease protein
MLAIFKREFRSYFQTMVGPVFIAIVLAFVSVYFMSVNLFGGYPYFSMTLSNLIFLLLISVPILTMKSFAEDRRSKAEQMIFSAPVSLWQITLGKYFAMVAVYAIPCAIFCLYPQIIHMIGNGNFRMDYAAIFVYFLIGCAFIAVGMFVSSLTESQIIAVVASFGVLFLFYLWDSLIQYLPSSAIGSLVGLIVVAAILCGLYYLMARNPTAALAIFIAITAVLVVVYLIRSSLFEGALAKLLGTLSIYAGMDNINSYQLLDFSAIIKYISLAFFFVFLTVQGLHKRRWA